MPMRLWIKVQALPRHMSDFYKYFAPSIYVVTICPMSAIGT